MTCSAWFCFINLWAFYQCSRFWGYDNWGWNVTGFKHELLFPHFLLCFWVLLCAARCIIFVDNLISRLRHGWSHDTVEFLGFRGGGSLLFFPHVFLNKQTGSLVRKSLSLTKTGWFLEVIERDGNADMLMAVKIVFRTSSPWCLRATNLGQWLPPTWTRRAVGPTPSSRSPSPTPSMMCNQG